MTDRGPIGRKIKTDGIPVLPLGMGLGRPTLSGLSKLFHFLKQESVDIIQTWLYHADLLGLIVGRMAGVRRVIWGIRCSDLRLKRYRPLTAVTVRLGGALSSLADAIVVNSQEGMRIHKKRGYQTERMILIPNGFDTTRFRPDESAKSWLLEYLGLSHDVVLIGLIARFDPMKDHGTFLKAASLLARENEAVHFILVGKGMVPQNPQLTAFVDHHLENRVHFLGIRDDMPRLMAALDAVSSSSLFGEGFSNTVGEAMSCGVPCVVTDVGDSAQIVGDTGIVVPPEEPKAMAGAWQQLLEMGTNGRRELGELARLRIADNFEIGKVVHRFEAFYQLLAKSS